MRLMPKRKPKLITSDPNREKIPARIKKELDDRICHIQSHEGKSFTPPYTKSYTKKVVL